ncbi:hypothetical protein CR513_61280, partial [Mucuna pruriens]
MCWIYFLKCKSEATLMFWKFIAHVENQSNFRIQIMRLDIGKDMDRTSTDCPSHSLTKWSE